MSSQTTSGLFRSGSWVLFASLALAFLVSPLAAQTRSNARIVRLSFVDGTVNLQQPGADKWTKAFVNTPIQQGFELATDANSFAEVEFENGSTARLGQTASLQFTELSIGPDGSKINHLTLGQGYGTFTVVPEQGDVYQVDTLQGSFMADGKATFRVDLEGNDVRLEVFKGHVQAKSQYGEKRINGKQVLEIQPGESEAFRVNHGITHDAWDHWVDQRNGALEASKYAAGYRNARAFGSPYRSLYGWNDLYYYGNWANLPGYGYGWVPYVSSGWMPYSMGSWGYYPGFGYTWISSLPWGWLPFHYGNWVLVNGYGWSWLPGNFSSWSPAVVSWYQGSGWVGWSPLAGRYSTGNYPGCQAGLNCSAAVSLNTFQSGGMVTPHTLLRVNPTQGTTVRSPNITTTNIVRLPGSTVSSPSVLQRSGTMQMNPRSVASPSGPQTGRQTFMTRTSAAGVVAPHTVVATPPHGFGVRNPPGIVFNSQTHRYERTTGMGGQMSGMQGSGNRSNSANRNNAPQSQPQMNRGVGTSTQHSQPSGGFGGTTQMPGGMGNMGGGMQMPHSGGGGTQGPHH